LPVLRWESGSGHGQKLHLWRASEDSRGLRVLELTLSGGARGTVRVREGWIPRARAFGALRQLAVLARLEPRRRPQPGDFASESWSSANFHARVRCEVAGETVLAAAFTGSPSTSNLPDRFRAEAAVRVLAQAVATAQWTERAPRASDREALRERQTEQETVYWVRQRLRRLDEVLPGRQ
ncbi:MAG: hypothetical protein KDE27_14390, partial [Planctomycetes bacterium]|nr:hypothetical protein [Planctomycetota bacterium]